MTNRIDITFEGPRIDADNGIALDDFQETLEHVRRALRLMVEHLMGVKSSGSGKPSNAVRAQSTLRLVGTSPGSLRAHMVLEPPPESQAPLEDIGPRALADILSARSSVSERVPEHVQDELEALSAGLSSDVSIVSIADPNNGHILRLPRADSRRTSRTAADHQDALLFGWLREVNWANGTAQLHNLDRLYVALSFDAELGEGMRNLATKFVRVAGKGRINDNDAWTTVKVEEISATSSWKEPFNLDAFLNDPNPKMFDPDKIVTASEPFDVDEFIRIIHEGRDVQ